MISIYGERDCFVFLDSYYIEFKYCNIIKLFYDTPNTSMIEVIIDVFLLINY